MKRVFFIAIGIILLPLTVSAAPNPPDHPTGLISPYAEEVIGKAERIVAGSEGGGTSPCLGPLIASDVISWMKQGFLLSAITVLPPEATLARSACFTNDVRILEEYAAQLSRRAIDAAQTCESSDAYAFANAFLTVWHGIVALRQNGLNPTMQSPLDGEYVEDPLFISNASSDDALCPYSSDFADIALGGAGCMESSISSVDRTGRLRREAQAYNDVRDMIDFPFGFPFSLERTDTIIADIWSGSLLAYRSLSPDAILSPGASKNTTETPNISTSIAESGCYGWPTSSAAGTVRADGVALFSFSNVILTQEMERAIETLFAAHTFEEYDYLRTLKKGREDGSLFSGFSEDMVQSLYTSHWHMAQSWMLSLKDPQRGMYNTASRLHTASRSFASTASRFDEDDPLPPLRRIAAEFATFLARSCVNRGCLPAAYRTIELAHRDACFTTFLLDRFFSEDTGRVSLPLCRVFSTR